MYPSWVDKVNNQSLSKGDFYVQTKVSPEIKIHACKDFLSGKYTSAQVCEKYGITYNEKNCSSTSLSEWMAKYRAAGPEAFTHSHHNKSYSSELKPQAVEEYLSGKGTILEITVKYGISDTKVFRRWILKYNANIELKSYDPKREVYMAEARRKTTLAERKEIVGYSVLPMVGITKERLPCMMSHTARSIPG